MNRHAGTMILAGGQPFAPTIWGASFSPGSSTLAGLDLLIEAGQVFATGVIQLTGSSGFTAPLDLGDPAAAGLVVYLQAFAADSSGPAGFTASNTLAVAFCP